MDNQEKDEKPVQVASELNDRLGALFDSIESAMEYARATVSPMNNGDMHGNWVEIHKGRADSSYRLLIGAMEKLAKIRTAISA